MSGAAVGVTEHGNSAILVTLSGKGEVLDRRRVDLTEGLPTHPYHHEGSWAVGRYKNSPWAKDITLAEAIDLIERVHEAASRGAVAHLAALANDVSARIDSISLRKCPQLPPTTEERIADNRAQSMADSVMYRQALADAAQQRGWNVRWYDRDSVFDDASRATRLESIDDVILAMGKAVGPPWQAKHKLAAAAALAALRASN